jgi:2-polyprenylphenol 6-hydroxylase
MGGSRYNARMNDSSSKMAPPGRRLLPAPVRRDVCIVGNGVIGKAAALALAQAGLSVTLLSPAQEPGIASAAPSAPSTDWDLRVYALNHVAQALLAELKVWDALDASRVAPVDGMEVHGDGAAHAGRLAFDAYSARVGALAWIVEHRNLNLALDTALRFASNVHCVSGSATRLQIGDDEASVQLEQGETLSAALLLGADGSQSWVRHQLQIGIDYRPYGQRAVVANFECEQPHRGIATQWFTSADGIIALLPLAGQRVSLVWSAPDALADVLLREPLAHLAERLSQLPGHSLGRLQPLPPHQARDFPLALIRAHAITAPRVALVGDAAHVVHPLAGHGMNLGFADVADLVAAIRQRGAQRDCGDAHVLARYARARKEEILLMQIATDGLERLFASDFEPLRIARNLGLNLINKLPVIKRGLMAHALGKPHKWN